MRVRDVNPVVWVGSFALLLGACGDGAGSGASSDASADLGDALAEMLDADEVLADTSAAPDVLAEVDAVSEATAPDATEPEDTSPHDVAAETDTADDTVEVDAPVIDPEGDSDGDGIADLAELEDGTDPFDPRSARAWHPEIAGHPRLFADPSAQPLIAARAAATTGRAAPLWARVLNLAQRPMPSHAIDQGYDTSIPPAQSQIAEAAALVGFATGDLAMTGKALEVLAAPFPDPSPLNELSQFNAGDHYDLLEAEALHGFCSAYDLAAGTPGADPALLSAARQRLVERIDYFRSLCMTRGGCATLLKNEPNNHTIKSLAAIGVCAVALPDRPEAAADFNEALVGIDWLAHERQGNREGGWAESWNYLSYSGETHLGFLVAAARHAPPDGRWRARAEGWVTRLNPDNGKLVDVLAPGADPLWRAVYERALLATMPWGLTPPVDDANPSALHGGLLAALFDDDRFLWNWDLPRVGMHTGRQLVATFLFADLDRPAREPTSVEGFFPDAGFSVLRSSLATTATYLHIQHEPERMRLGGGAHEHADPLSIILAAHGTDLAIDPGYIDFTNHGKVKYGKDHNIVLVDGQGPEFFLDGIVEAAPSSDAFLHEHEHAPPFSTLIASTKYGGAELRRRVVRVTLADDLQVFVIADRPSAQGTPTWTFQLNGLASEEIGGTSFELTPTDAGALATWRRPAASLWLTTASTSGVTTAASRLEESSLASGRHRCLTVDAAMGSDAGFVTLLVPALPELAPTLSSDRPAAGIARVRAELDAGRSVTAYLNHGAPRTVDARTLPYGLTLVVAEPGLAVAIRSYGMDTPEIPDPNPF